ncbi:hypothetical protein Q5752_004313 [Cryptotrichosporon argae]
MSFTGVARVPKGLHHLEPAVSNKFQKKYPSRAPHPPTAYVAPAARVRRWNVVPGDLVRLLVGKPKERFNDETKGKDGGYKVYRVSKVDMERNRVYLDGISNKKANPIMRAPDNFDELTETEQASYRDQKNYVPALRAVHYSNVQLCVDPESNVFASRIATSAPSFDRTTRRLKWDRFASKLSGETSLAPDAARGQVEVRWPENELKKRGAPSPYDTPKMEAHDKTLLLPNTIWPELASAFIPASPLRAPPPADQGFSDTYINARGTDRHHSLLNAFLPLYLSEELSPRFSRAKKTAAGTARRATEARTRVDAVRDALDDWEAGGRDAGLKSVLELDPVGLEGVSVRARTRAEVREGAGAQFDAAVQESRDAARLARLEGRRWVQPAAHIDAAGETSWPQGYWVDGPEALRAARKRGRKERKERKIEERMRGLRLNDERNTVVPADLRV